MDKMDECEQLSQGVSLLVSDSVVEDSSLLLVSEDLLIEYTNSLLVFVD